MQDLLLKETEKSRSNAVTKSLSSNDITALNCGHINEKKFQAYCILDSITPTSTAIPRLLFKSFNHISREVLSLSKSSYFYTSVLGFQIVPRPVFEVDGVWLSGFGVNLHLIKTNDPEGRLKLKSQRIQHFTQFLPSVDHFAFEADSIDHIISILNEHKIFYKFGSLAKFCRQIFFFDPDGNVIEAICFDRGDSVTCAPSNVSLDMQMVEQDGEVTF